MWLTFLLLCANLFGQSSPSPSTFHISGKITQLGRALPDRWVGFEGASIKFVKADSAGHYEAELPLGIWKAAVVFRDGPINTDSSLSRPRVFQVTTPARVTLDLYVHPVLCSLHIFTPDGRPPTEEEKEEAKDSCAGQEFFPISSGNGTKFAVVLGGLDHSLCSLAVENRPACEREFATFNLFTVQADRVAFTPFPNGPFPCGGFLDATGSVLVNDGEREYRRNSVRFLVSGGQAIEAH